jgi:hypothetical protein
MRLTLLAGIPQSRISLEDQTVRQGRQVSLLQDIHAFLSRIHPTPGYGGDDAQPQLERCRPFGDA